MPFVDHHLPEPKAPKPRAKPAAPKGPRTEPLYVDLIPSTSWYCNLRSVLTVAEWNRVKAKTFAASNNLCQACGGRGKKHPVECHERWSFDMESRVQAFVKTVALCPSCHRVCHIGWTGSALGDKMVQVAKWHLGRVNEWEPWQVEAHIEVAFEDWGRRSAGPWTLDISNLIGYVELGPKTLAKLGAV